MLISNLKIFVVDVKLCPELIPRSEGFVNAGETFTELFRILTGIKD